MLGLEGAGKTTLVSQITTGLLNVSSIRPTEGFHVTNLVDKDRSLNIWDGTYLYTYFPRCHIKVNVYLFQLEEVTQLRDFGQISFKIPICWYL